MMITPLSSIIYTENKYATTKTPMPDNIANHMPNGLLRIPEIQSNKNINNQVHQNMMKNIFTTQLSPSIGSFTENFIKAKSLISPLYRNNEAIAKYEAVSISPINLKHVKKDLDRVI